MNTENKLMTDEQYEFCKKQASVLAKIIMDLDIQNVFGKDGNALFIMETIVILTAGTLSVLAKKINVDPVTLLNAFYGQTEHTIKSHKKKPILKLVH